MVLRTANHERTHRDRFGEWRTYAGYEVRDPLGHRIGTVAEVLADLNDEPRYARVKVGLFGLRSVLIPVKLVAADTRRRVLMIR
jgi:hypothetical protein